MRLSFFLVLVLLTPQACRRDTIIANSVEGKLVAKINASCSTTNSCTIRIRDVVNFDWDKMYVFKYTAREGEIEEALGFPLPHYEEFTRKIVFVRDGKLVYFEEEPTDIESLIDNQVVFGIPDDGTYLVFGRDPSFIVTRKSFHKGSYYEFKLVQ